MHARTHRNAALAALVIGALSVLPSQAGAAGLYFADRGVRPAARGGAFVAGADDLGAIVYNPAGVYEAGTQFLTDGSWVDFRSEYTREALLRQVDPNTGETTGTYQQTFDTVHGKTPFLPIPTLAASLKLNPNWVVYGGVWAPYATLTSYPEQVNGRPAPQRYGLFTLDGSVLAFVGLGAAYAPSKEWRFGASLGALVGTFATKVNVSGCVQERFFCASEDPDWDFYTQLKVGPIVAPTGQLGAIWIPSKTVRLGASFQLPVYVRASGKVASRFPSAPVFERASLEGQDVSVAMDLPWNLRGGVEMRAFDQKLRVELGLGYEHWAMHDTIKITPHNVVLKNVTGFPENYRIPEIDLPRHFNNSASVRLGAEYSYKLFGTTWDARAGASFESTAVPAKYLTVLTIDAPKVTASIGGSVHIGRLRLDAMYAHVFAFDVDVDPKEAAIPQIVPIQSNPPKNPDIVNAGHYRARADILGVGLAYTFDPALEDPDQKPGAQPGQPAKDPEKPGAEPGAPKDPESSEPR